MSKASALLPEFHPALITLVAALALVGCASPTGSAQPEAPGWTEPGWMAQARQAEEQRDSELSACMRDAGYQVEVLPGSAIRTAADDSAAQEAIRRCVGLQDGPGEGTPSEDQLRTWYARAIDTRDCLQARGYTVSEPPSLETWLEQQASPGPGDWIPFGEAIDQMTGESAADEYAATYAACPQDGAVAAAAFPERERG